MKDPIIAAQRVVSTAALYEIDISRRRAAGVSLLRAVNKQNSFIEKAKFTAA